MVSCHAKHTKFQPTDQQWKCPKCGTGWSELETGQDFYVDSMDDLADDACELLHHSDIIRCTKCELFGYAENYVTDTGWKNMNYDPSYLIGDEPDPEPNDLPAVWDLVVEDMRARDRHGLEHYGTRLQPFNGRKNLVDLYQELLDAAVYARAEIYEREQPCVWVYDSASIQFDTDCNFSFCYPYIPPDWKYCPGCGRWIKKEE